MKKSLLSLALAMASLNSFAADEAFFEKSKKVSPSKKRKKKAKRGPASSSQIKIEVFPESTRFEELLKKKELQNRLPAAFQVSARVIAVRRELALTRRESESIPQDIVLNAGAEQGLSEGLVLKVIRKVPVLDPFRDSQQSELEVELGTVRIIHVQKDLAVARIDRLLASSKGLSISNRGVMVGDFVGKVDGG